jgi:hypothetical protein
MGRRETATVAASVVLACLSSGSMARAAELRRVVLDLTDYQPVATAELGDAQQLVVQAYARIGVELAWAGWSDGAPSEDASLRVRVTILNGPMSTRNNPDVSALGEGSHGARQAYIYYARIVDFARRTQSDPARVLAVVLAHELGRVLLPDYSHAPSGLMRPTWDGRIVNVPPFLPAQATTIRHQLATPR